MVLLINLCLIPEQTVPTYTSDEFSVLGQSGLFYVILSGLGLYDFNDWTYRLDPNDLVNVVLTRIAKTLLLLAITSNQSYRGVDYITLIINSNTTTDGASALDHYGYGDYQRFIPGPGLGMTYQPGTSDGANPTVPRPDSPIPFPNLEEMFGDLIIHPDRFQKLGLRDTIQDLFLNGDLSNLFGTSIIKPWVPMQSIPLDITKLDWMIQLLFQ